MKKILIPTDFSILTNNSIDFALQLARLGSASLKLLHVIEPPVSTMTSTGEVIDSPTDEAYILQLVARSKTQLIDLQETYWQKDNPLEYEVVIGDPALSILNEVKRGPFDLIVMGSKGMSWVERLLLGSTAEKVIRNATCPVITIKGSVIKLDNVLRIVYAFNPADNQTGVFGEVKKFTETLGGRLYLVTVVTASRFKTTKVLRKQMDDFIDLHRPENFSTHVRTDIKEDEGVMHFAEEVNADLIAVGIDSHTNLFQSLTTNSREDIINHSRRPVWTYNYKKSNLRPSDKISDKATENNVSL